MHMCWLLQMESEMGQTEQSNTVILSDQTTVQKGHQYVQYIHVQKSYFTHRYEKKNHTSLRNCSITETIQATVYSF